MVHPFTPAADTWEHGTCRLHNAIRRGAPDFADWLAYFQPTLPATAGFDSYERHMKYRPTREYWNDYVFEAYVNYQMDAIYLAGLPTFPTAALIPRSLTGMAGRPGLHKAALAGGQTGWTT